MNIWRRIGNLFAQRVEPDVAILPGHVVGMEQVGRCTIEMVRHERIETYLDHSQGLEARRAVYDYKAVCHFCLWRAEGPDLEEIRGLAATHDCEDA